MPQIDSFNIDTSNLPSSKTTRNFTVIGDAGFEFLLNAVDNSGKFYNFATRAFSTGHTPNCNLKIKSSGTRYTNRIVFPASTGATYNIVLMAAPNTDTTINTDTAGGSENVINKAITQENDVTVTFAAFTANDENYGRGTALGTKEDPPAANVTSIAPPLSTASGATASVAWELFNRQHDSYGYGLRLTRQPVDTDWYFTTQDTVNGTVSSSTTVVIDDLTDIVVGMHITAVSSGSLSGTPFISSINTETKTLTMSAAQSFADGITLTFQARGAKVIHQATGLTLKFSTLSAKDYTFTQQVRTAVSNATTIHVKDTYGISGGSHVTFAGANVDNSSTNNVNGVTTADAGGGDSDGVITCDVNQTLTVGTVLTFKGSSQKVDVGSAIDILQYPDANRTIYLNLDNFITPGTAS